jgi:mannose/fructose/N-acetylgalactosamine-specific phosphotransferase system component IIB
VKKNLKSEEDLKNDIFIAYSEFRNETLSDRRQVCFELFYELTIRWCKDYIFIEDKECLISVELWNALVRFKINEKTVPKERNNFFYYLKKTLKNIENEYFNNEEIIHIPKNKKEEFTQIEKIIEIKESNLGRKLIPTEEEQTISSWFGITKEKARELIDEMRMIDARVVSLDRETDDGTGNMYDMYDLNLKSLFEPNISYDQKDEPIEKHKNLDLCDVVEAVKYLLENTQERSRDCYRALFTLHCIDNGIEKCNDFEKLYPLLDSEIMETWQKDKKKLNQYVIYQKYHPNSSKETAENKASANLRKFLNDIKAYCERKGV